MSIIIIITIIIINAHYTHNTHNHTSITHQSHTSILTRVRHPPPSHTPRSIPLSFHRVGASLLKGDWKKTCEMLLEHRRRDKTEITEARNAYRAGNINKALRVLPKMHIAERALLEVCVWCVCGVWVWVNGWCGGYGTSSAGGVFVFVFVCGGWGTVCDGWV